MDSLPEPKADYNRAGLLPFGPMVCLIVRHDGKLVGVEKDRHDASWTMWNYHDCNDYEVRQMPVGMVPIRELTIPEGFKR